MLGFFISKYILLFFADFKLLEFCNNIVEIAEVLNTWNLLKTCNETTYLVIFCIFYNHFYYGKTKIL